MNTVTVYWSDEIDDGPITPAIKYSLNQTALASMTLPDFKGFSAAGVQRCPGFVSYFKNSFVYRSPVDITITRTEEGGYTWWTSLSDQSEIDRLIETRDAAGMLSICDYVHLWCNEPMKLEQIQPTFIENDFSARCEVVPGTFDISRWFRPLQPAFKMRKSESSMSSFTIKRGDPLYVIRFLTDKKVVLKQFKSTDRLKEIHHQLMRVKSSTSGFHASISNYYEIFKERRFAEQIKKEILAGLID